MPQIVAPTGNRAGRASKRKRQTYAPKFHKLYVLWDQSFCAHAARFGYEAAASQARSADIKHANTEFPTEPTAEHIDWWRRKLIRDYKAKIKENTKAAMGWDDDDYERARDRNRKLLKAAEAHKRSEDHSKLYFTDRKLLSPEEREKHDRQKRNARQNERRRRTKRKAEKEDSKPSTSDNPNFGRF